MRRRIFVAIPIPEEIKQEIRMWQDTHHEIPVRWIKPENLHTTLVPPWYVSEDEFYHVENAIREAVHEFRPFTVHFRKILWWAPSRGRSPLWRGGGPQAQPPRLICTEGETPKEFIELKEKIEAKLLSDPETDFFKKEKRPAKLHLTIARFKPLDLRNLPRLDGEVNWQFEVNGVNLMSSELKRTGAEYTALQIFAF